MAALNKKMNDLQEAIKSLQQNSIPATAQDSKPTTKRPRVVNKIDQAETPHKKMTKCKEPSETLEIRDATSGTTIPEEITIEEPPDNTAQDNQTTDKMTKEDFAQLTFDEQVQYMRTLFQNLQDNEARITHPGNEPDNR